MTTYCYSCAPHFAGILGRGICFPLAKWMERLGASSGEQWRVLASTAHSSHHGDQQQHLSISFTVMASITTVLSSTGWGSHSRNHVQRGQPLCLQQEPINARMKARMIQKLTGFQRGAREPQAGTLEKPAVLVNPQIHYISPSVLKVNEVVSPGH